MSQPNIPRKGVSDTTTHTHRPSESTASLSSSVASPISPEPQQSTALAIRQSTPPPYSGPSTAVVPSSSRTQPEYQTQPTQYPGLPRLDYRLYSSHSDYKFTLSDDKSTITTQSPILCKSPSALLPLIQALASVPPKPVVRITGVSQSGTTDFDVWVNCMNLVWSEDEKKRMNYLRTIGASDVGWRGDVKQGMMPRLGTVEEWVRRFCEEKGGIKQFTLERIITNWDTSYLEGRLLTLISSTKYGGRTTISFPLTHSKVVVLSPDKYNKFFSNVTKAFTGCKRYEVVKSVWPYADVPRESGTGMGRRSLVQDEERWFLEWKSVIKYAVLGKRKGWVTIEDRLAELMEPRAEFATGAPTEAWGSY